MSNPPIQIEFSGDTQDQINLLSSMPDRMMNAIRRGIDKANDAAIADISAKRMYGRGPYPVAEGKLGVVTNRLRSSLRKSAATISGTVVTGTIGSNVVYAGVHEFGAVIQRTTRAGSVRLRTDKGGNLIRQVGYSRLATFAKRNHKNIREVNYKGGKSYTVTIPARAPIGHGIADSAATYDREINTELHKAWEGK